MGGQAGHYSPVVVSLWVFGVEPSLSPTALGPSRFLNVVDLEWL